MATNFETAFETFRGSYDSVRGWGKKKKKRGMRLVFDWGLACPGPFVPPPQAACGSQVASHVRQPTYAIDAATFTTIFTSTTFFIIIFIFSRPSRDWLGWHYSYS